MSCDYGVWYSEKALTDKEAAGIYIRLCDNWPFLEGENHAVAAFYEELTGRWPEIDSIAEERVGDFEYCPWSVAIDHSGMAVIMACVWPKADEVGSFVQQLAAKHKLIFYDPQSDRVHLPDHLKAKRQSFLKKLFG